MAYYVSSGQVSNGIILDNDSMYIFSGGTANSASVSGYWGYLHVSGGGTANQTTVNSRGSMYVSSGGTANQTTVNYAGAMYVSSGGNANVVVENGGYVEVGNGADVTFDSHTFSGLTITNAGATVHSGTTANMITFTDGWMVISSGGSVNSSIINSRGRLYISSGGIANDTTVNSGGSLFVSTGGKVTGALNIVSGALVSAYDGSIIDFDVSGRTADSAALVNNFSLIQGTPNYTISVSSTHSTGNYKLAGNAAGFNSAMSLTVGENTYTNALTVGESYTTGGRDYTLAVDGSNVLTLTVAESTITDPLVVTTAADVVDANDGVTSLREAVAYAQSLGGETITFNGNYDIQLSSSLSVSKNTVIDGGHFSVSISGSENAPVFQLANASLTLKNLAVSSPYTGEEAGIVSVTTGSQVDLYAITDGGNAGVLWSVRGNSEIHAYDESMLHRVELLTDTSVWGTAIVKVFDSAQVENISIAGQQLRDGGDAAIFGRVKNLTVLGLGDAYVYDGGTAENVRVENNGIIIAQAGGTVNGLTLEYGGVYAYTEGSFLDGTVIIAGAARAVAATDSSIISNTASVVFDLSQRTEDSNFTFTHLHPGFGSAGSVQGNLLVDSIRPISGAGSFTVNVSNDQEYGTYKLAGDAAGFNSAISLTVGENTYADALTVGGSCTIGERDYSLAVDSSNVLTLTIAEASPLALKKTADDLNGDGRADIVMTISQFGHGAYGSTGAWLIQADQTPAWGDLTTRNYLWSVFGMGFTAAGKNTADVNAKSTDNVIGAWTTGDDGRVNGWETIGSFDADAQVIGLGDFNGNGQSDLLLRAANGAVGCFFTDGRGWNYFQSLGDEWKLCAIGDLNGDGRDDVVLKHDAGFAGSWLTQENGTPIWADLDTLPDGFEIIGAGDFNGDGTDDVLLQNGSYFGAWLTEFGNAKAWMGFGNLGDATIEQIADFNGDGVDDLRIRTAAGDIGVQLVMGADTLEWHYYGSVGAEWNTSLAALS